MPKAHQDKEQNMLPFTSLKCHSAPETDLI